MLSSAEDERELMAVKPLLVCGYALLCLLRSVSATMPDLVANTNLSGSE